MGNEYNFEEVYKYNHDSQVSLTINLPKTCYSKGEYISGNLYLKTKKYMQEGYLLNPQATVYLSEIHNNGQPESDFDIYEPKDKSKSDSSEEEKLLFYYEIDLSRYAGANLFQGISIPFELPIPTKCSPSCIFDKNIYIRHLLTFDFISIKAKKTSIIIIKNDKYFSLENNLYKSPAEYTSKITKHQYAIFNKGFFNVTIKLPKNSFKYDEVIPFLIEIDCTGLNIQVKSIKVSLNVMQTIKDNKDEENNIQKMKELANKNITLTKGDKKYLIDDVIKLPSTLDNPKKVYEKLDKDKRKFSEKYKNLFLLPSIYDKILVNEYFIKAMLEMDTIFSTNESFEMPIEFYEDENINEVNKDKEIISNTNNTNNMINTNTNYMNNTNNINNSNINTNVVDEYVEQLPDLEEIERSKINNINENYNNQQQYPIYPNSNNIDSNNYNNINYDTSNNNKDSNEGNTTNDLENYGAPPSISQIFENNNDNNNNNL